MKASIKIKGLKSIGENITTTNTTTWCEKDNDDSFTGNKVFMLGVTPLDGTYNLSGSYKGYISTGISDLQGLLSPVVSITISGVILSKVVINYDTTTNGYATKFLVDGTLVVVSASETSHQFNFSTSPTSTTIQITKWSSPNTVVKITSIIINDGNEYVASIENGLMSFTRGSQCVSDNTKPEYKLIGNYGSFSVKDDTSLLEDAIVGLDSVENMETTFYLDNYLMGKFKTSTFEKDGTLVKAELKSIIDEFQEWKVPAYYFGSGKYVWDFYSYLSNLLEDKGYRLNVVTNTFYRHTKNLNTLARTIYKLPVNAFVYEDTMYNQLTKLAQLLSTPIYVDASGYIVGLHNSQTITTKTIESKYLMELPKISLTKNNIYKNPCVEYYVGSHTFDENLSASITTMTTDTLLSTSNIKILTGNDSYMCTEYSTPLYDYTSSNDGYSYSITRKPLNIDTTKSLWTWFNSVGTYRYEVISQSPLIVMPYFYFNFNIINPPNYLTAHFSITFDSDDYIVEHLDDISFTAQKEEYYGYWDFRLVSGFEYINIMNMSRRGPKTVEISPSTTIKIKNGKITISGAYFWYHCEITNEIVLASYLYLFHQYIYYNLEMTIGVRKLKLYAPVPQYYDSTKERDYQLENNELMSYEIAQDKVKYVYNNYNSGLISTTLTYSLPRNSSGNIDTAKLLRVGDIIIPYKRKNGVETALVTKNNAAVKFQVTSVEINYSGCGKMEVDVLEYKEFIEG